MGLQIGLAAPGPRVNGSNAMSYTLGTAAKATGLSKSTIHRAIKAGKITATKTAGGDWSIDAAELHRVFPPGSGAAPNTRLEAEIAGLREITTVLRSQLEDLKTDRDAWRDQAQAAQRLLTDQRGFFSKLFRR